MDALQLLQNRIELLLEKYTALQDENKRLNETIQGQLQSIDALNGQLTELEDRMGAMQQQTAVISEADKTALNRKIDIAIAEIDKMLHQLND